MQRYIQLVLGGCAAVSMAACGGSSTGTTVLGAGDVVEGTVPVSYDPTTAAVTLNGNTVVNPRDTLLTTKGDARLFESGAPTHRSAIAENEDVYAIVVASDGTPTNLVGAAFGRREETVLPDGEAAFSGDYAGLTVRSAAGLDNAVTSMLTGDVALTVNFDDGIMSGSITNREVLTPAGTNNAFFDAADVIISDGTIAENGTFSATTSGGEFIPVLVQTWTSDAGSVNGVLGGETGASAAGILRIEHSSDGSASVYNEVGAFVATED